MNKTKDIHLNVFDIVTRIDLSKTFLKHISCESKSKFGDRKY